MSEIYQMLKEAIQKGDRDIIRKLLASPSEILLETDDAGWALLHYVASKGDVTIAKHLIGLASNLEIRDNSGSTPLHYAAAERNGVVALLIEAGAEINARDNQGKTPLHRIAVEEGGTDIVSLLLKAGADPHIRDMNGDTASDLAVRNHNPGIASLLKTHE